MSFYFLSMLRQKNDNAKYSQFAMQQYNQTHDFSTLLDLVNFKMQLQAWDEARQLLASLDANDGDISQSSQYWLAKANWRDILAIRKRRKVILKHPCH